MIMRRVIMVLVLLFCSAAALAAPFNGSAVTGRELGRRAPPLWDHHGQPRKLADYHGKVVLVFVGFLNCASYCPVTLAKFRQVMDLLGDDAGRVQVLYVTLDPERDTPDQLKSYLGAFHPAFVGLYAQPDKTQELAKSLGAHFQKVPGSKAGSYTIDHTVDTLVFDPQGQPRLILPDELAARQIAEDLRRVLRD